MDAQEIINYIAISEKKTSLSSSKSEVLPCRMDLRVYGRGHLVAVFKIGPSSRGLLSRM